MALPRRGVLRAEKLTPAPFGLFSVASVTESGARDEHWGMGFSAESEACAFNARLIDVCDAIEGPVTVFDSSDSPRWVDVKPFGIVVEDECLTPGISALDRRSRVIRQLELITPKAVETELWAGLYRRELDGAETGMYLSSTVADIVESTAQKPKVALALLEQALADCSPGFQGVIHMSPLVGAMIGNEMQQDGDRLLTANGNRIAIGSGYDGRGPGDDTAPTNKFVHWIYATGPVFVQLGSEELVTVSETQAVNATTNVMTWVAERPAAVYWDGCCHFAAKVDVRL